MCGIAGILSIDKVYNSKTTVESMIEAMKHRGPDATGFYNDDFISLGHGRLAIIDLSEGGAQPKIDNSDRYVITFNGEIYNYKKLKIDLQDYNFKTSSDTEVIVAAYATWGESCVDHLTGQFAFAIWDKLEKKLFLARDRMGEKPLYFFHNSNGFFVFASELTAIVKSGLVPNVINVTGIVDFLKYQSVTAPNTLIKDVFQLMPGHIIEVVNGKVKISRYWTVSDTYDKHQYLGIKTVQNEIYRLLNNSVTEQMMSDVPMGAFLSGGIDSSAIVALMAQNSEHAINTFTIEFEDEKFNEGKFASLVANKFKTIHTPFKLRLNDFMKSIPEALEHMDAISGDGLNTYVVSKLAKDQGITVALSGLGGDDLFGGYLGFSRYYSVQNKKILWKVPHKVRKSISSFLLQLNKSNRTSKLAQMVALETIDLPSLYSLSRQVFSSNDLAFLCPELPFEFDILTNQTQDLVKEYGSFPIYGQYGLAELNGYTSNVLLKDADRMSMAHSLEIRAPFFNHELVSYCLGIPDHMKFSPFLPKKLLVDSLKGLLPKEVTHREKMGFSFPWDKWLRSDLNEFVTAHIIALSNRSIFDKTRLLEYYDEFKKGRPDILWSKIWLLVVLDYYLEKKFS